MCCSGWAVIPGAEEAAIEQGMDSQPPLGLEAFRLPGLLQDLADSMGHRQCSLPVSLPPLASGVRLWGDAHHVFH